MSLFFKPFSLQQYETWMLQINVGWNNSLLLAAESVVNLTLEERQQDTFWVLWTTCSQKGVHNLKKKNWYIVKNMDASATRKNKQIKENQTYTEMPYTSILSETITMWWPYLWLQKSFCRSMKKRLSDLTSVNTFPMSLWSNVIHFEWYRMKKVCTIIFGHTVPRRSKIHSMLIVSGSQSGGSAP